MVWVMILSWALRDVLGLDTAWSGHRAVGPAKEAAEDAVAQGHGAVSGIVMFPSWEKGMKGRVSSLGDDLLICWPK